nr:MAG TPA: hypothetical protein [Caudoviricetes sp.]
MLTSNKRSTILSPSVLISQTAAHISRACASNNIYLKVKP